MTRTMGSALACLLACILLPTVSRCSPSFEDLDTTPCLPDTIFVVEGRSMRIFYDQLVAWPPGARDLDFTCIGDVGSDDSTGVHIKSVAGGGIRVAVVASHDEGRTVFSAHTVVRPVGRGTSRDSMNVLLIGDSLVAAHPWGMPERSYIAAGILDLFQADEGAGIRLIGTAGAEPTVHEGYNGRRWVDFVNPPSSVFDNPFWDQENARLDFRDYMKRTGQPGPVDACIIQLGYNDLWGLQGQDLTEGTLAVWTARIDGFLEVLLSPDRGYPGCRVVISLPSSGNIRASAWESNYGSLDHHETYERNMAVYRHALKDRYDSGAFDPRVDVCASGVMVDRTDGYPVDNYLHPAVEGYRWMAEAFHAHLRALSWTDEATGVEGGQTWGSVKGLYR